MMDSSITPMEYCSMAAVYNSYASDSCHVTYFLISKCTFSLLFIIWPSHWETTLHCILFFISVFCLGL